MAIAAQNVSSPRLTKDLDSPRIPLERTWLQDLGVLAGAAAISVLLLFLFWEGIEQGFATNDELRHRIHYARGISSSLVTAAAIGVLSYRQHRRRVKGFAEEAARRKLEAEEARTILELVVDNTPASLLVLDRDFRIVQANRMAEEVHGRRLEGQSCFEAIAGCSDRCADCPAAASLENGVATADPHPHTDPSTGEVLTVESHPFALPDGRQYVLLVERIVTEQKKLQARLVHQEKMAAFGLLAAGIAHDMGNPLSSIEAQLQLIDDPPLPNETAPIIGTVRHEVARLRRILRELVDFARRRRDEATLVSMQAVAEDALRLLRHDRRMREVKVIEEYDSNSPPVTIVEDHLMQVVLNLLINSVDAMPSGGTLRLEVRPVGNEVVLRVHDSGSGMDRSVLSRVFEPLFTTKAPGKGTGLGLSIAKDLLVSAGGDIELHSAPGRGTMAVVTLPAAGLGVESVVSRDDRAGTMASISR